MRCYSDTSILAEGTRIHQRKQWWRVSGARRAKWPAIEHLRETGDYADQRTERVGDLRRPRNSMPMGRPSEKKPPGTEIAGNAVIDASTRLVPGVDFGTSAGA